MKLLLALLFIVVCSTAIAQQETKKDTTLKEDYGMKLYDPRIGRYMPVDTSSVQSNPYAFKTTAVPNKRKSIKKTKSKNFTSQPSLAKPCNLHELSITNCSDIRQWF